MRHMDPSNEKVPCQVSTVLIVFYVISKPQRYGKWMIFWQEATFHFIGTSTWRWLMAFRCRCFLEVACLQILQLSFGGPLGPSTPGRVIWVAVDSWSRRRWAAWRIDNWSDLAMVHIGPWTDRPSSQRVNGWLLVSTFNPHESLRMIIPNSIFQYFSYGKPCH